MADPSDFGINAARSAGYTDSEIADFVAKQVGTDIGPARQAGYDDGEILRHIVTALRPAKEPEPAPAEPPAPESRGTWKSDIQTGVAGMSQAMAGNVAVRAAQEVDDLKKQIETFGKGDPELPAQLRHLAPQRQRQIPLLQKKLADAEKRYAAALSEQAQDARTLETLPVNEPARRFAGGELGEALKNPGAVARGLIGQSLPAMVPLIVGAALGGVPGGAIAGGAIGAATGGGQEAVRILAERQIDAKDPEAVKRALADPEIRVEIDRAFGIGQAIDTTVGAATGGLGGVTVPGKTALRTAAKNVGLQAAGQGSLSAGGEAAKQGIIEGEIQPGRVAAAGLSEALFAPADAAAAAFHGRGKSPVEAAKPVLDAPDTDAAIAAAAQAVSRPEIDTIDAQARDFGSVAEQQQASLLKLFGGLNEGTVERLPDGSYQFLSEASGRPEAVPLRVWEPGVRPGEGEGPTISPALAAAQRVHYENLGVKVVYFENDPGIMFDGAVDPRQPDTIFLSNHPTRNAAQVGAHEFTHLLESTRLPDGTNLADLLHRQISEGLTSEGIDYAGQRFGSTAPDRASFPNTPEGQAAHADAVVSHLIRELGADIGGEAPKFQTFVPRVVEAVEARYGADVAKDVLRKLIDGIRQTMRTLREFFSRPEEMPEFGQPGTESQKWVTNLEAIHDTLAKMYAEKYQTQVERERARLEAQRPAADVSRETVAPRVAPAEPLPAAAAAPPEATVAAEPPAAPEVAAPQRPGPEPAPAYAEARDRAERLERWLGELEAGRRDAAANSPQVQQLRSAVETILGKVNGVEERLTKVAAERLRMARERIERLTNPEGDNQDMALVRAQLTEERQRMADAAAVGTGPAPGTARATGLQTERVEAASTPEPLRGRAVMERPAAQQRQRPPVAAAPARQAAPAAPPRAAEPAPRAATEAPRAEASPEARSLAAHERLMRMAKMPEVGVPRDWQPTPEERGLAERVSRGWAPEAISRQPQSLTDFVRKNGGLRLGTPEAGDMRAADIGRQPGLLRLRGHSADTMAQMAKDNGFRFGRDTEHGSGVDVDAFVKALIEDASGRRKHQPDTADTAAWRVQRDYLEQFGNYLADIGFDPKGIDARTIAWVLKQSPEDARLMSLLLKHDRLGEQSSIELAYRLDAEAEQARAEMTPEPGAWEMGDPRELPQPTRAELERFYADYERATGQSEPDAGGAGRSERSAGGEDSRGEAAGAGPAAGRPAAEASGAGGRGEGVAFSPRLSELSQTTPLIDTREVPKEELSARQRQVEKERAQLQMQGKARRANQQDAEDLPLFGGERQKTLFSPKEERPPFYSALTRGVEGLKVEKAPPGQWEATLRNMPGIKAEERAWSGVDDWLRSHAKPVTKDELLDYLRAHEIRVEEVQKGGKVPDSAVAAIRDWVSKNPDVVDLEWGPKEWAELARGDSRIIGELEGWGVPGNLLQPVYDSIGQGATKFGTYVLPGGENYRELLLTLPERPTDNAGVGLGLPPGAMDRVNFHGSHWDEPNVLAHIRFDDRTGPNGERVLHVAEVQSDWMQTGRKKGFVPKDYRSRVDELTKRHGALTEEMRSASETDVRRLATERGELVDEMNRLHDAQRYGVPDAPFKTTWPELAMKRVIRYAAEHGYDRVSWDTGATNADRYDLSKQLDKVSYDGQRLWAWKKDHGSPVITRDVTPEGLPDVIGKEAAERLMAQPETKGTPGQRPWRTLENADLKVGGEGMLAFYDKQLPIIAGKLAKRFGSKVEDIDIGGKPRDEQGRFAAEGEGSERFTAHSITVTNAMRDSVMQGQPLFSPKITGENPNRKYTAAQRQAFENVGRATQSQGLLEWVGENKKGLGKKFIANALDPYRPILEYAPQAYIAARNANSSTSAMNAFVSAGTLKFDGDAYNIAKKNGGVENYLIRPLGDEAHDFAWWVAAHRAERLKAEDRENLFSESDIANLKKLNRGELASDYTLSNGKTTRSREAAYLDSLKKLDEINRSVMELDVESGLVKRDQADALLANPYYINFRRVAEDGGSTSFAGATSSGLTKQYAFKKLKGGTEKLNADLWHNMFGTWEHQIDAAIKNKAARKTLDVAEQAGAAVRLTKQEAAHLSDKDLKSRTVWVMENGEKVHYAVEDPMLLRAVSALNRSDLWGGPIMDGLRSFKRLLTAGVTMNPAFIVKNFIRANLNDVGISNLSPNLAKNIYTGFRQNDIGGDLSNVLRAIAARDLAPRDISDSVASAMAGGGLMNVSVATDTGVQRMKLSTMLDTPDAVKKLWNYVGTVADSYRALGGQAEQFNRIALYEKLRAEGVPHDAASFAARDLMDFTLRGPAATVRFLTDTVPFMNAWLQGLYKTGRAISNADKDLPVAAPGKKPASTTARAALMLGAVTMGLLALDAFYADDPDYQRREEYDRNANFWFKIGDVEFRVPMGFEIASMARIAANGAEVFFDKNMDGERFWKNAMSILMTNMNLNPIPQAFKPAIDVAMNETRTGRPIENKGMERLRSEERFTLNNTLTARALSSALNTAARAIGGSHAESLSPVQIDYLVQAYGGWLATQTLSVADNAVRALSSEPDRPEQDTVAAVTQGMIRTSPSPQSRYVNLLYEQAKGVERAYATYTDMVRQGRISEAKEFFADNRDLIQRHGIVSAVTRMEGDINRQIRLVTNSPEMTAERKRLLIQQLQAQRNRIAEKAVGAR